MKTAFLIIATGTLFVLSAGLKQQTNTAWVAPKEADAILNPLKSNADATAKGKLLYAQYCTVCHGEKGKGDGIGGMTLVPKPANHTTAKFQAQTDGAIFWKLTNGRPPMASYKVALKDEQRWQLVDYMRTLAAPDKKSKEKTTASK